MLDEMRVLAGMRSELPADALATERAELLFQTKLRDELDAIGSTRRRGREGALPARRRPLLWAISAAAAAVALAVVTVVGAIGARKPASARAPKPGGSPHALSAAGVFHAAAREAAAVSPIPEPKPDQWIYTSVVMLSDGQRSTSDSWIQFGGVENAYTQDGKLVIHTVTHMHNGQMVPDIALAEPVPAGVNPLVAYNGMPMSSYAALASLNQPPAALLNDVAQVVSGSSGTPSASARPSPALAVNEFNFLAQLLWNASLVPAGTEANVFKALATLPGITVQPNQTDAAGQPAIAVGTTGADSKQLLFDPNSYRVLGFRSTMPAPQPCTPTTCKAARTTPITTTGATGASTAPTSTGEALVSTSFAYVNVALVAAPGDR